MTTGDDRTGSDPTILLIAVAGISRHSTGTTRGERNRNPPRPATCIKAARRLDGACDLAPLFPSLEQGCCSRFRSPSGIPSPICSRRLHSRFPSPRRPVSPKPTYLIAQNYDGPSLSTQSRTVVSRRRLPRSRTTYLAPGAGKLQFQCDANTRNPCPLSIQPPLRTSTPHPKSSTARPRPATRRRRSLRQLHDRNPGTRPRLPPTSPRSGTPTAI